MSDDGAADGTGDDDDDDDLVAADLPDWKETLSGVRPAVDSEVFFCIPCSDYHCSSERASE